MARVVQGVLGDSFYLLDVCVVIVGLVALAVQSPQSLADGSVSPTRISPVVVNDHLVHAASVSQGEREPFVVAGMIAGGAERGIIRPADGRAATCLLVGKRRPRTEERFG